MPETPPGRRRRCRGRTAGHRIPPHLRSEVRSLVCLPLIASRLLPGWFHPEDPATGPAKRSTSSMPRKPMWESIERLQRSDGGRRARGLPVLHCDQFEGIWRFELEQPIPAAMPVTIDRAALPTAHSLNANNAMARMPATTARSRFWGTADYHAQVGSEEYRVSSCLHASGYHLNDGVVLTVRNAGGHAEHRMQLWKRAG